jgi:DNA helicase-2/ATP-dependent DNA helicase PcrA
VREAAGQPSASRLRAWAHDILDEAPSLAATAPGLVGDDETDPPGERRVAAAALDYLRDAPLGDGAGFRAWVASTAPFGSRDGRDRAGVELLTFHAAKGREWPIVVVTGVETGLVPHRSAGTVAARAEEARLLHVALTRAADRLVITRAERRRGYVRQASPLLAGLAARLGELQEACAARPAPADVREAVTVATADALAPTRRRAAALAAWRLAVARATARLPEQVCSDADLRAIAADPPGSAEQLAALTGMGPVSAATQFPALRAVLDG